jgi:hypothetical protein
MPTYKIVRKYADRKIEALPPNQHDSSPIVNSMTCVVCYLANGDKRHFGIKDARIGPDLRMHMIINPRDEVLVNWEASDFFGKENSNV